MFTRREAVEIYANLLILLAFYYSWCCLILLQNIRRQSERKSIGLFIIRQKFYVVNIYVGILFLSVIAFRAARNWSIFVFERCYEWGWLCTNILHCHLGRPTTDNFLVFPRGRDRIGLPGQRYHHHQPRHQDEHVGHRASEAHTPGILYLSS